MNIDGKVINEYQVVYLFKTTLNAIQSGRMNEYGKCYELADRYYSTNSDFRNFVDSLLKRVNVFSDSEMIGALLTYNHYTESPLCLF